MAFDFMPRGFSETACWNCGKEITPLEASHVASITREVRVECRECAGTKLLNDSRWYGRRAARLATLAVLLSVAGAAIAVVALVTNG